MKALLTDQRTHRKTFEKDLQKKQVRAGYTCAAPPAPRRRPPHTPKTVRPVSSRLIFHSHQRNLASARSKYDAARKNYEKAAKDVGDAKSKLEKAQSAKNPDRAKMDKVWLGAESVTPAFMHLCLHGRGASSKGPQSVWPPHGPVSLTLILLHVSNA
jgi:hypothetical protein